MKTTLVSVRNVAEGVELEYMSHALVQPRLIKTTLKSPAQRQGLLDNSNISQDDISFLNSCYEIELLINHNFLLTLKWDYSL